MYELTGLKSLLYLGYSRHDPNVTDLSGGCLSGKCLNRWPIRLVSGGSASAATLNCEPERSLNLCEGYGCRYGRRQRRWNLRLRPVIASGLETVLARLGNPIAPLAKGSA